MPRFKKFDVVAKLDDKHHRVARIRFGPDGSIYVILTGFSNSSGIMCRGRLNAGVAESVSVDLTKNGKVTSHLVKYAHHPDGEAHFSQDGKIKTLVRRKAAPLEQQVGHLFSLHVQDITSLPKVDSNGVNRLTFRLSTAVPAFKIVGWRYPLTQLPRPTNLRPGVKPEFAIMSNGVPQKCLFAFPPRGAPFGDVALVISATAISPLSQDASAHLLLVGGFDPHEVASDLSRDLEFLALSYPCANIQELKQTIGTVDLNPSNEADAESPAPDE
jgi:hypothetical protein